VIFGQKNELEKLATREMELSNQKRALVASLQLAEQSAGEALAAGEAEHELADVLKHRTKLSVLDLAVSSLRKRRPAVIAEQFAEQARGVRADAAEKKKQLAEIESKTSKLLRQLSAIEGVTYSDAILSCEASGPNMFFAPKSDTLRYEITQIEAKADSLESRAIPDRGEVDLEDVIDDQAVIAAALMHPSHGPTAESVQAFLMSCAKTNRLPEGGFGNRPRRVRVQFFRGEIDYAGSYVYVRELAKPHAVNYGVNFAPGSVDVETATFRPETA
jgi:hypothetical protein